MESRPLPDAPAPLPPSSTAAIAEIAALLATEIFSARESTGPLFRAAYAWLILNVHDVLQELDRAGHRVSRVDECDEDITDLIGRARYAIVHGGGAAKRRSARAAAASERFVVTLGLAAGHADDIAVETGGVRILIRRHAVRAFEAARDALGARVQ